MSRSPSQPPSLGRERVFRRESSSDAEPSGELALRIAGARDALAQHRPPLIVVVGPTASGKSDLALWLAGTLEAEIVSADSRQVYRGLDLGTGKATVAERERVPHHLLDVADPGEAFNLAHYQALAYEALLDLQRRGRQGIMVGGTGLYVRAVVDDFLLPGVPPEPRLRRELASLSRQELVSRLLDLDPRAGERTDLANPRRVIRAIEVLIGRPRRAVASTGKGPGVVSALQLGLSWPRQELYRRIDERLAERMRAGMLEEVRRLLSAGISIEWLIRLGLEYRHLTQHLAGDVRDLEVALDRLRWAIHAYARRQLTWFRADPRIVWLDVEQAVGRKQALRLAKAHLASSGAGQ